MRQRHWIGLAFLGVALGSLVVWLVIVLINYGELDLRKTQIRKLAIAMHDYHNEHNRLPNVAIFSKDGEPLLSWRVQLLPYLNQKELYEQFKLDEPWDSEHNKKLIDRMPANFHVPGSIDAGKGQTYYQVFVSPAGIVDWHNYEYKPPFSRDPTWKMTLWQLTVSDGTSHTISIAEAGKAVVWTKPEDMTMTLEDMKMANENLSLPKLGCLKNDDSFLVVFFDTHVVTIRPRTHGKSEYEKLLRDVIGYNDGNPPRVYVGE